MNYKSYMIIMVMLIAVASLFVLKRPDGQPWLSMDTVLNKVEGDTQSLLNESKRQLDKAVDYAKQATSGEDSKAPSQPTIYKWQDAQGNWIYSDKPNPKGNSRTHHLDPSKVTIMDAEDTSILYQKEQSAQQEALKANAMNPQDVKALIKDTKNIQKLMDDRQKQLDAVMESNSEKDN